MALDVLDYRKFAFRITTEIGTTSSVLFVSMKRAVFREKRKKNYAVLPTTLVRLWLRQEKRNSNNLKCIQNLPLIV